LLLNRLPSHRLALRRRQPESSGAAAVISYQPPPPLHRVAVMIMVVKLANFNALKQQQSTNSIMYTCSFFAEIRLYSPVL